MVNSVDEIVISLFVKHIKLRILRRYYKKCRCYQRLTQVRQRGNASQLVVLRLSVLACVKCHG